MNIQENIQLDNGLGILAVVAAPASAKLAVVVNVCSTLLRGVIAADMRQLPAFSTLALCKQAAYSSVSMIHGSDFSIVGNMTSTWRGDPE